MRLDVYLSIKGFFDSRNKAKEAIERGEVFVCGKKEVKPSREVDDGEDIQVVQSKRFVSLGGYKLDKALDDFKLDVSNLVAVDVGASTGGFTDCLLQRGAKKVYAVDLNDGLLHSKMQNDERVELIIKNAKEIIRADFGEEIQILTADLSFISATAVLDVLSNIICDSGKIILLIKPQFEAGARVKFKNGIIRDNKYRISACKSVYDCARQCKLFVSGFTMAPISEDKNIEYLILLTKIGDACLSWSEIEKACIL